MNRLHFLAFVLSALVAGPLAAADFCAVTVNVVDEGGNPSRAPVRLVDPKGQVAESVFTPPSGRAEFCDFGFGSYSIHVGDDDCPVILGNIVLGYGFNQKFTVVARRCGSSISVMRFPPWCDVYLRIASTDGSKLSGAETVGIINTRRVTADQYGRALLTILKGKSETFTVSAQGYRDGTVSLSCKNMESIEKEVRLDPLEMRQP